MSRRIARLKPKKIKGRISVLKVLPYKDSMVYIRRINQDIFEYMLVFKDNIYSSYMVITPKKGQTKLSKDEVSQCVELLWSGAEATIDTLIGDKLDKTKHEVVKVFEESRKVVEA